MSKKKKSQNEQDTEKQKFNSLDSKLKNLTERQKQFIEIGLDSKTNVFFIKGSAGTSKTYLSVYCALKLLLDIKAINKIIFIRTPVESTEHKMGFLPGDIDEKFNNYAGPFFDKLEEFIHKEKILALKKSEKIQIMPINFLRGRQFDDCVIIADECQNFTSYELKTLLTRLGSNSKIFLCGDITQSDLKSNLKNDFEKVVLAFKCQEDNIDMGINFFEFTDDEIVRSLIVKYIVKVFRTFELKT